jgi:hypothetical protein
LLTLIRRFGFSLRVGEVLIASNIPGRCFLATKRRRGYLHQRPPEPLNRCDKSARRQAKLIFAYFLAAGKK